MAHFITKTILAITSFIALANPLPIQNPIPLDPLDLVIDKLATCESSQIPDVIVIDTNGYKSYGWLQFQQRTFDYFGEKYGLPHDDIMSPAQQIPIAKAMLKNGLWKAWYNCLRYVKLDR